MHDHFGIIEHYNSVSIFYNRYEYDISESSYIVSGWKSNVDCNIKFSIASLLYM